MSVTVAYILSIIIASFMGVFEAILFASSVKDKHSSDFWKFKMGSDIHLFLTSYRISVFFPIAISLWFLNGWQQAFLYTCSILLAFSFFHNGFYYLFRKKLDGAYNGFTDESETTTAKISLSFKERFGLFLISLCLLLINYILF
jgi:hypothetical protein